MTIRLLFLDEELPEDDTQGDALPYMEYYVRALRKKSDLIDYTLCRSIEEAIRLVEQESESFDVISIDIQMPEPALFANEDCGNGTRTGIVFLRWLIDRNVAASVVLLTNVTEKVLTMNLPSEFGSIRRCNILEKLDTTPFDFVTHVIDLGSDQ